MDKLSLHQQDIMGGIMEELSGRADITIRMHYQDIGQFESELPYIRKYGCLRYISLSVSLYGDLVAQTIRKPA